MGRFFRTWQRQLGLCALIASSALLIGLLRSLICADSLAFYGRSAISGALSFKGQLLLYWAEAPKFYHRDVTPSDIFVRFESEKLSYVSEPFIPVEFLNKCIRIEETDPRWRMDVAELHIDLLRSTANGVNSRCYTIFLPYFYIIIPLGLASLGLLISPPCKQVRTKTADSTKKIDDPDPHADENCFATVGVPQ